MPDEESDRRKKICWKTKGALFWMSIANEPFVALYALIPFFLRQKSNISLFQISMLASLKQVVPVLSFYWGADLDKKRHRLKANLVWAWILARTPFLLIPWVEN